MYIYYTALAIYTTMIYMVYGEKGGKYTVIISYLVPYPGGRGGQKVLITHTPTGQLLHTVRATMRSYMCVKR